MRYLSVVSGTSTDGLTLSLLEISGFDLDTEFKVIRSKTYQYDRKIREDLLKISSGAKVSTELLSGLHWELGRFIADCAAEFDDSYEVISYSGHTVYHGPSLDKIDSGTYQIGEASVVCAQTGKTVIYDFRATDMAHGGLGAPLTAFSDRIILKSPGTLAVNIGGIANITYIGNDSVAAFDTGPGNMLIDLACRLFYGQDLDVDGSHASNGRVVPEMLQTLLSDRYFSKAPPKNTGREYFGPNFLENILHKYSAEEKDDFIRTLTEFTTASIKAQVDRFIHESVARVVVGGGGTMNPVIMGGLKKEFPGLVSTFSEIGIDNTSRECLGFAILANQTLNMRNCSLPTFTGKEERVLGKIIPGENFEDLARKLAWKK